MLVKENTMLKRQLNRYIRKDSLKERSLLKDFQFDQFVNYQYTPAKVLRNSISRQHNYLTINKGKKDGIESGMGVVSEDGIVGKVVSSSKHFALVMSLLHEENTISAQVAKNKELGTITWDGKNYQHARMLYLPRHVPIAKGDTIETSGYNAIFPEKVVIGVVDSLQLTENDTYYEVNVKLSTNFNNLSYVYVVADYNRDERMKLEEDVAKSE
jgi:rod shape-determining protein MreC